MSQAWQDAITVAFTLAVILLFAVGLVCLFALASRWRRR